MARQADFAPLRAAAVVAAAERLRARLSPAERLAAALAYLLALDAADLSDLTADLAHPCRCEPEVTASTVASMSASIPMRAPASG